MSTNTAQVRPWPVQIVVNGETRHRFLVGLCVFVCVVLLAAIALYGWNYYSLGPAERPLSAKHAQLKPSGTVGLKLGILGFFLFMLVYLYPLRKRWLWLSRQGKTQHWLDFHMLLGLVAPCVICFHSAFKIQGFAGMAFWTMMALAVSGLVGRYFYAQIPRSLNTVTLTFKETRELLDQFKNALQMQDIFDPAEVARLFHIPELHVVQDMAVWRALLAMIALDLERPFKVWSLRRRKENFKGKILSLGGILPTKHAGLEGAIVLVSRQASLAKRAVFLAKTERLFHLWHVIHRPFSLSFAIFVLIHLGVVLALGYF